MVYMHYEIAAVSPVTLVYLIQNIRLHTKWLTWTRRVDGVNDTNQQASPLQQLPVEAREFNLRLLSSVQHVGRGQLFSPICGSGRT